MADLERSRSGAFVADTISSPGSGQNEDRVGTSGRLAWVIDGSTPLDGTARSQTLTLALVERMNEGFDRAGRSKAGRLESALDELREALVDLGPRVVEEHVVPPTAAVGIVEVGDDRVSYFILGDVTVAVESAGAVSRHSDDRVNRFDQVSIAAIVAAQARGLTLEEARAEALPILREHRFHGNSPEGYWIAAPGVPEAVDHGVRGSEPLAREFTLLVASDGFARLVDVFRSPATWPDLLAEARRRRLEDLVAELRDLERVDDECVGFPRLSVSDDASAVVLRRPALRDALA